MCESEQSVVFRLSYLLGVKESVLKQTYKETYVESKQLKLFENYWDAKILRLLSALRQSVFINYLKYSKKQVKNLKAINPIMPEDFAYLKGKGIDIEKAYQTLDLVNYINLLTKMINIITYKVLVDIDCPHIEKIKEYFYFPEFDFQSLKNFVESITSLDKPNGIVFYYGKNIKTTLKYLFNIDKNFIKSAYSMLNEYNVTEIGQDNFIFRTKIGEDLDSDAKIHFDMLFAEVKSPMSKSKGIEMRVSETKVSETKVSETKMLGTKVSEIKIDKSSIVAKMDDVRPLEDVLVIDCKSISMLQVLAFISDNSENYSKIVLSIYNEQSIVWDIFTKLYKGTAKIEILRQLNGSMSKSGVDTFIAFYLGKIADNPNIKTIHLISENKNIFYLLEKMNQKVKKVFTLNTLSENYVNHLCDNNISVEKMLFENYENIVESNRETLINYSLLYTCYNVAVSEWGTKKYYDFACDFLSITLLLPVLRSDIEMCYELVRKKVTISKTDTDFMIALNDLNMTFKIGG